jgi:hypothetical protein
LVISAWSLVIPRPNDQAEMTIEGSLGEVLAVQKITAFRPEFFDEVQ